MTQPNMPGAPAAPLPAFIYHGEILEVDPSRWICKVRARQGGKMFKTVRIPSVYMHHEGGEGIHFMPEPGAWCWVCVPSDSEESAFLLSGSAVVKERSPTGSPGSMDMNRPILNPGDLALVTRDGNGLAIRRGGVVELRSTPLAKVVMDPVRNKVIQIAESSKLQTFGGSSEWKSLRREENEDGLLGTKFTFKAKEYADHPGNSVQISLGKTGKSPVNLQFNDDQEQETVVEETSTYQLSSTAKMVSGQKIVNPLPGKQIAVTTKTAKSKSSSRVVDFTVFDDESKKSPSTSINIGMDKEGDISLETAGAVKAKISEWGQISVPGDVPANKTVQTLKKLVVTKGDALGNTEAVVKGETFMTDLGEALTEVKTILSVFGVETPKLTALLGNITTSLASGSPYLSNTLESE